MAIRFVSNISVTAGAPMRFDGRRLLGALKAFQIPPAIAESELDELIKEGFLVELDKTEFKWIAKRRLVEDIDEALTPN